METMIQTRGVPRSITKPRQVGGSGTQPAHRACITTVPRKI